MFIAVSAVFQPFKGIYYLQKFWNFSDSLCKPTLFRNPKKVFFVSRKSLSLTQGTIWLTYQEVKFDN